MTLKGHHDFETSSTIDIGVGAHRYAEDPETRVWCMSWRIGDAPVRRWHPGDEDPRELLDHVERGGVLASHNSMFERCIWNLTLRSQPRYARWPALRIEQQCDTMARALAVHLPASLDQLGALLGLAARKDEEGARLMKRMARPRRIGVPVGTCVDGVDAAQFTQRRDGTWVQWWNTPENLARLGAYCDQDVEVECAVDARLPPLSDEERVLWVLDQRVNDRGVALDVASIERACAVRKVALERADARMAALTDGEVRRCTETGRLVAWLRSRGVECDSVAKDGHDDLLVVADCLGDAAAREAVVLRGESTKTSTAKLEKMLSVVCADGRARGLFSYHRALTGRWGGQSVQPQNLPRVDEDRDLPVVLAAIDAMEMCA